jgi:hypothetical protein
LYGETDDGTPYCSPDYAQLYPDDNQDEWGWQVVFYAANMEGIGPQSCIIQGSSNPSGILTHFGQPINLNGANLAWVNYAEDVGTSQSPNLATFRSHFQLISQAGGNSARWWMHINGTVTPAHDSSGYISGLSSQRTNEQVIDQMRQILDAAWDEGVVLTITLFSFDMLCNEVPDYNNMLNNNHNSYLDNALAPLVAGLKDHPALFAWEIFNESEGMTQGTDFFSGHSVCAGDQPEPKWVFQRFVNHAAARIHQIDPNVKVTTSLGHPSHINDFSNGALTSQNFSLAGGTLDFYQVHWYNGSFNPYTTTEASYQLDKPIVIGEFSYKDDVESGTSASALGARIFEQGYAGAWVWDLVSEAVTANLVIAGANSYSGPIDKAAVENCIQTQESWCYNGGTFIPPDFPD